MKKHTFTAATLSLGLLLSACSNSAKDDAHATPRETQAWENVDISAFSQEQLLERLSQLANEATVAAAAGQSIEFHHLEVALTPTLEALETKASGNETALKTLKTLKDLAVKLHIAGHDGNVTMGTKLAAAITTLNAKLATEL